MGERPVLILTGAPGTGKTTVASILAEREAAAVHLETDVFFRFIRSGYIEPWKPESGAQNQVAMGIAGQAAAAYAAAGYVTVVEGVVLPSEFGDLDELEGNAIEVGDQSPEEIANTVEQLLATGSHLV